ncbi:MAG: putative DNA binding protein [Haloarculaceae archaeon]|jgi:predicted DNA binding protein
MSKSELTGGTRLTLDLWHPNCWAIEATSRTGGGVLAHAVYDSPRAESQTPSSVTGLFTAYGDTTAEVDQLLDEIQASEHAGDLQQVQDRFGRARSAPGSVVQEFLLEYDPNDMVCPTLLEHGFIHSAPVQIEDGREEWQVCFAGDRSETRSALDRVRDEAGADVTVASITSNEEPGQSAHERRLDTLTPAQREVFEHAREVGYYEWPRKTSTRDLADDLDISKTTLLEHLRKAESKLLDP